jgi:outer membrane cobalamin receptor
MLSSLVARIIRALTDRTIRAVRKLWFLVLLFVSSTAVADPTVTIIDRAILDRFNFPSLTRAISMLAGVDVQRTYFKQGIVTVRGILQEHYANKVLILIDGVPTWNAVTGEAIIDRIDIHDVERIEVTNGPSSVEHGSNAYAGAINIVLRHTTGEGARATTGDISAHAAVGTESMFEAGMRTSFTAGIANVSISANSRGDDGRDRTFVDERGLRSRYSEYQRGNNFTLDATARQHHFLFNAVRSTESFLGNTPDLNAGLGLDHRSRGWLAAYQFAQPVGTSVVHYRASYDRSARDFARTGDNFTRSNVEGERLSGSIFATLHPIAGLAVDAGGDYERRRSIEYTNYDVRSDRVLDDNNLRGRSVGEWSLFARGRYDLDQWKLAGGARYVRNSLSESNLSGEASVERRVTPKDGVAVVAAQSFRAPSFFELYFRPATNTVFGNLALEPETSTSYALVWTHTTGNLDAKATVYHARYENKIFRTRRLPADPVDRSLVYVNGSEFAANGVELELRARFDKASTFATYTFVDGDRGDAIAGTNHYNFRYVPQHAVSGGISTNCGPWSLASTGTWRSSTNGPLAPVSARSSIDLDLGYTSLISGLTVRHALVATNAFDSDGEMPEFVRRNLNTVPSGLGRRIAYTVTVSR